MGMFGRRWWKRVGRHTSNVTRLVIETKTSRHTKRGATVEWTTTSISLARNAVVYMFACGNANHNDDRKGPLVYFSHTRLGGHTWCYLIP